MFIVRLPKPTSHQAYEIRLPQQGTPDFSPTPTSELYAYRDDVVRFRRLENAVGVPALFPEALAVFVSAHFPGSRVVRASRKQHTFGEALEAFQFHFQEE